MAQLTRRNLLRGALAAAAAGGMGWRTIEALAAAAPRGKTRDAFAGGRLIGLVPFATTAKEPLGELTGSATFGRRRLDLSTLNADSLLTPSDRYYVHTRVPQGLPPASGWRLGIRPLNDGPVELTVEELQALAKPQGVHLCESAHNGANEQFGLISAAEWKGVPVTELLTRLRLPEDKDWLVMIDGHDRHAEPIANALQGAAWIFSPADLERTGAFLATEINGQPLPPELGQPLRLVVPGWYGCAWVKWVYSIVVVPVWTFTTPQMKEYAAFTFQSGTPKRVYDYVPPVIDGAAMPVRVEQWEVGGKPLYRVVGIVWGGEKPAEKLFIRFQAGEEFVPVDSYQPPASTATWALWSHTWRPKAPGVHAIQLRLDRSFSRTRRLAAGMYRRDLLIEKV